MFPTNLAHFTINDAWGDPQKMVPEFLYAIDNLRETLGQAVIISCGTQGIHEPNSLHYEGRAADIVLPSNKESVIDLFFEIARHPFTGIGYYPHWAYKGFKVGGWHLEMCEPPPKTFLDEKYCDRTPRRKLWMGVLDENNKQVYIALNWHNLNNNI